MTKNLQKLNGKQRAFTPPGVKTAGNGGLVIANGSGNVSAPKAKLQPTAPAFIPNSTISNTTASLHTGSHGANSLAVTDYNKVSFDRKSYTRGGTSRESVVVNVHNNPHGPPGFQLQWRHFSMTHFAAESGTPSIRWTAKQVYEQRQRFGGDDELKVTVRVVDKKLQYSLVPKFITVP